MAHFISDFEPHPKRMAPDPVAPEATVVPEAEVQDELSLVPAVEAETQDELSLVPAVEAETQDGLSTPPEADPAPESLEPLLTGI